MNSKIRVNKFLVIETGTYNTQFRRPFSTEVTSDVVDLVNRNVDPTGNINNHALNSIASQFILPTADHEGALGIQHGWDTRRLSFMMEVEVQTHLGLVTELVLGYSEHADVSYTGQIDPDMLFYVNSVSTVRRTVSRTPIGTSVYTNLVGTDHILVDNEWTDVHNAREWRMRPEDMFATIGLGDLNLPASKIYDGRSASTGVPVLSNRRNAMAGQYASRMLNIHRTAQTIARHEDGGKGTFQQARDNAREHSIQQDTFLSLIDRENPGQANRFSIRQLKRLDNYCDADDVMHVVIRQNKAEVHSAGQTAHWDSSDGTTRAATVIGQEIPGYMMELGLTNAVIFATNETLGGEFDVRVENVMGFSDVDLTGPMELLIAYIISGTLPSLTFNNQIAIQLELHCDLMGETFIRLSLNGESPVDYVVPSFCDAILSPVVTASRDHMFNVAHDFSQLFEGVNRCSEVNTLALGQL